LTVVSRDETSPVEKLTALAKTAFKNLVEDYKLRNLVDQAFSKNNVTRVLARAKLKKEYPDVYGELDL